MNHRNTFYGVFCLFFLASYDPDLKKFQFVQDVNLNETQTGTTLQHVQYRSQWPFNISSVHYVIFHVSFQQHWAISSISLEYWQLRRNHSFSNIQLGIHFFLLRSFSQKFAIVICLKLKMEGWSGASIVARPQHFCFARNENFNRF